MLAQGTLSTSINTLYFLSSNSTVYFKSFIFYNDGTLNTAITLYIVPNNSGSIGNANNQNKILYQVLEPGETYEFSPSFPIDLNTQNDSIKGKIDNSVNVNFIILGKAL
jgi:hypothetical protein